MLVRLVCGLVKPSSISWHTLARYEACKAWRDFEVIKDGAEMGREKGKFLLILLNTINESIDSRRLLVLLKHRAMNRLASLWSMRVYEATYMILVS